MPSTASVERRRSRKTRKTEGAIHFAGKLGVNGGNIGQSALARKPGVSHIVEGTRGRQKAFIASHYACFAAQVVTRMGDGQRRLH